MTDILQRIDEIFDTNSNSNVYSSKPLGNLLDGIDYELQGIDCKKRNNCGPVALNVVSFLKKKGIDAKRVQGKFKTDVPDVEKTAFTNNELNDMKIKGYDVNNVKDRVTYAKKNNIYDELFLIPHYWVITKEFGIIDMSIGQFKKFVDNISDENYISE